MSEWKDYLRRRWIALYRVRILMRPLRSQVLSATRPTLHSYLLPEEMTVSVGYVLGPHTREYSHTIIARRVFALAHSIQHCSNEGNWVQNFRALNRNEYSANPCDICWRHWRASRIGLYADRRSQSSVIRDRLRSTAQTTDIREIYVLLLHVHIACER